MYYGSGTDIAHAQRQSADAATSSIQA